MSLLGLQLRVGNHQQVPPQVDCFQLKCLELVLSVQLVSLLLPLLLELLLLLELVCLQVVALVLAVIDRVLEEE